MQMTVFAFVCRDESKTFIGGCGEMGEGGEKRERAMGVGAEGEREGAGAARHSKE